MLYDSLVVTFSFYFRLLRQLHWLKVPERIKFRLCVHRCLHIKAPPYLAETLHLTTEGDAPGRLRSASTSTLTVPSTHWSTTGGRAFPVAAACAWNSLPLTVRTVSSLNAFWDDHSKQNCSWHHLDDRTRLLPLSLTTDTCNLQLLFSARVQLQLITVIPLLNSSFVRSFARPSVRPSVHPSIHPFIHSYSHFVRY